MVWVKLDDQFYRNPKARAAGKDGRALFLAGLCYCASQLTDGFISTSALRPICADAEVKAAAVKAVIDAGLWREVDGGWEVHDFNHYNPPSEKIRKQRDEGRERAARSRERRANDERTYANGSRDPSSSRPLPPIDTSVECGSSSCTPTGEDDPPAWAYLEANRRLGITPTNITDPAAWLAKVATRDVWPTHAATVAGWQTADPTITDEQIAARLAPRPAERALTAVERLRLLQGGQAS